LYDARSFLELVDYTQLTDCQYRPAIFYIFQFHLGKPSYILSSKISPAYLIVITAELCPIC